MGQSVDRTTFALSDRRFADRLTHIEDLAAPCKGFGVSLDIFIIKVKATRCISKITKKKLRLGPVSKIEC